jgi:hypothetical protein
MDERQGRSRVALMSCLRRRKRGRSEVALTASDIDGALLKGSGEEQRTRWGMTWGIHLAEWMWRGA